MLRGCEYQIWQTVAAWIDLRDEQVLFVEMAEDFDVTGDGTPSTVQVKVSEESLSLNRSDVLEAIDNYWSLRKRIGGTQVFFRYLARGKRAVERKAPFGAKVKGLDLWMRRDISDVDAIALRGFLAKKAKLSGELRQWLGKASAQEMRVELLEKISWETESESVDQLVRGIQRRLLAFSQSQPGGSSTTAIERVADRLFSDVWKTLRKDADRSLDRFDLQRAWDEVVRVSVTPATLDALGQAALRRQGPSDAMLEQLQAGPPPLPKGVIPRPDLAMQIRTILADTGLVNIHGSMRMGKTTLAKLVIAQDATKWQWWSATSRQPEEVALFLRSLLGLWTASPASYSLVLDDINLSPTASSLFEDDLALLMDMVRSRRGRVLLTSQKSLPGRLQTNLDVQPIQDIDIPRLSESEIYLMADGLGCPDDECRQKWSRFALATTQGHPQLATVLLRRVQGAGWPLELDFGVGLDALSAERTDARQLLGSLPESQRTLLHRLSVFPRLFRRDHAVGIAAKPPPLTNPGDVFDPLVGPWLEPLHSGYFAISPLITDSAQSVLSREDYQKLQMTAAIVINENPPHTTTEGAMAFRLLLGAKEDGALVATVQSFFGMPPKLFNTLQTSFGGLPSWPPIAATCSMKIIPEQASSCADCNFA